MKGGRCLTVVVAALVVCAVIFMLTREQVDYVGCARFDLETGELTQCEDGSDDADLTGVLRENCRCVVVLQLSFFKVLA